MILLYNFFIILFGYLIKFYSLFNPKAQLWIQGRKQQILPDLSNNKVIWMHCSSLGEFEQGRPVFERLKRELKNYKFVLSFFSPSGFERLKGNQEISDFLVYLPLDIPVKVQDFLNYINPEIAIFVKYDFWFNFIKQINDRKIKLIFISVLINKNHKLLAFYNRFLLEELKRCSFIFTQDEESLNILKERGFKRIAIAGDTRIDRVMEISSCEFDDPVIKRFSGETKSVLICGSTWEKDIELLSLLQNDLTKEYKLIIVPHEISRHHTDLIVKKFSKAKVSYYSNAEKMDTDTEILIIDRIGILSRIYRYAKIVYIGGGFGKGIHNTLEPASYSVPVIFGPRYHKFVEAATLVERKAFFSVKDHTQFKHVLTYLKDKKNYSVAKKEIQIFFEHNKNASVKIIDYIEKLCDATQTPI